MKKSFRKKILLAAGVVILVVAAGIAIAALEPFAERFEGKTVRQWVRYYANRPEVLLVYQKEPGPDGYQKIVRMRGQLINKSVVDGFGTNGLKELIAECKYSSFDGVMWNVENALKRPRILTQRRETNERRHAVAKLWTTEWAEKNPDEFAQMLKTNNDDAYLRSIFHLSADPLTGISLLDGFTNHADQVVRERAMKLKRR